MDDLSKEKTRACELASCLLDSDENYLEHVIELRGIGTKLYGEVWDTEFHIFGTIESDTDHLPTSEVRENCASGWLEKSDQEVAKIIQFYKETASEACNEILSKHCNT